MVKRHIQSGRKGGVGGRWAQAVVVALCWSVLLGCQGGPARYPKSITTGEPIDRIKAIVYAGDTRDTTVVPLLVDRLEDEDPGVRFYAILSLEKICGTRLGYDYAAPDAEREAAVRHWRDYISQKSPPAEAKAAVLPTE